MLQASWWPSGVSGRSAPTSLATFGPQMPAQQTTTSARKWPRLVTTPLTRPPVVCTSSTSWYGRNRTPRRCAAWACAFTARTATASPSVGVCSPPSTRSGSSSECSLTDSSAEITRDSTPHEVSQPCRRCSSASRSGVVATSRPPTGRKHGSPSRSSAVSFSTVYRASSVMVFDGLHWNTRPGAWELEPPVAYSGPWSSTVMSVQPRTDSSSASAAPTTPAPMMTTRGPVT